MWLAQYVTVSVQVQAIFRAINVCSENYTANTKIATINLNLVLFFLFFLPPTLYLTESRGVNGRPTMTSGRRDVTSGQRVGGWGGGGPWVNLSTTTLCICAYNNDID